MSGRGYSVTGAISDIRREVLDFTDEWVTVLVCRSSSCFTFCVLASYSVLAISYSI